MLNAEGTRLLMPFAAASGLENLFDLLEPHDGGLRALVGPSLSPGRDLCRDRRLLLRLTPECALHLNLTLHVQAEDTLMAAFSDVTLLVAKEEDARRAEAREAEMRGKVDMASRVLHDIGNAITGIGTRTAQTLGDATWPELENLNRLLGLARAKRAAFAEALGPARADALVDMLAALDDGFGQRHERYFETLQLIQRSVHHVQQILSIQHSYAQLASGTRRRYDLLSLADDAVALHQGVLDSLGVEVTRAFPFERPLLEIDPTQIVRVILNLIKNASEALDGVPERRIELAAEVSAQGVELSVRDSGSGFEAELGARLFEQDFTTKTEGTGSGLASSLEIVQAHGGSLSLTSEGPGRGATAHLVLPLPEEEKV